MDFAALPQRGLLRLTGEDTITFLQGLITTDANRLAKGEPLYAVLLSPQGKFLHDFFLIPHQGAILLDGEKERLPDLIKRLTLYKLRSKVEIIPAGESAIAAWGGTLPAAIPASVAAIADPRLGALGFRLYGPADTLASLAKEAGWQEKASLDYDRFRLALAVPEGSRDMVIDRSLLLQFGIDDLHGVDFKKGCYVGQEVTARSHYRGQVKKFIYRVDSLGGDLPAAGTPVYKGDAQVGEMRSSAGNIGLALLQVAEVQDANDMRAGEVRIAISVPGWAGSESAAFALKT